VSPKLKDRPIVTIKQEGTTLGAFNAVNRRIDSITTTAVFSCYKPNPYKKIAKE
jgi:hypothetical protein